MRNSLGIKEKFSKAFRGYKMKEVELYIQDLFKDYEKLLNDNKLLMEKIDNYDQKERYLQSALITAEETSAMIKIRSEKEALEIIEKSKDDSIYIIKVAEEESKAYQEEVHKTFNSYTRELHTIIEKFFNLAHKQIYGLERDLAQEIGNTLSSFDNEIKSIAGIDKITTEIQALANNSKVTINQCTGNEYSISPSYKLKEDIIDSEGEVIAKKETIVTQELVKNLIDQGLKKELISAMKEEK